MDCKYDTTDQTDYSAIKNPFSCKVEGVPNRFFCANRATSSVGDTALSQVMETTKGDVYIDNPIDPKLEYLFVKTPDGTYNSHTALVDLSNYDYEVPAAHLNKCREISVKEKVHKTGLPISFLQIDNVRDGIIWYRKHYPRIPNDLYPIIARYHWGSQINKHTIKKERKAVRRERGKKQIRADIRKGDFKLTFD